MTRFACTIAYDGTHYLGWQETKMGPSIQQTIKDALFTLTQAHSEVEAASRTDRGVHAEGQIVSFVLDGIPLVTQKLDFRLRQRPGVAIPRRGAVLHEYSLPSWNSNRGIFRVAQNQFLSHERYSWSEAKLIKALNAVLPRDIRVRRVTVAEPSFHPTLMAKKKLYRYDVALGTVQDPFSRKYAWHIHEPIDVRAMEESALGLIGKHNFQAFACEPEDNPMCRLLSIVVKAQRQHLSIALEGDRFLYKMARTIAGTLIDVGRGKLTIQAPYEALVSQYRPNAGVTAPAHGLFLCHVDYGIMDDPYDLEK
jgi:tRNA pseudouridine38-40 synthase